MDDDSGAPILEIDDKEDPAGQTKLPNSHSAALVMSLIVLCVVSYFIYRFIRAKCCPQSEFPREDSKKSSDAETTEERLRKQHEDYLAIYGPKKNINTISGAVSKDERTEINLSSSLQN